MAPTSWPSNPHSKPRSAELPVQIGMVVEDAQTGFVGAVMRIEYGRMELEDRRGRRKPFPVGPGYLIDGQAGHPHPAAAGRADTPPVPPPVPWRCPDARAKVALASRIYVEGRHDAELVEQVWGDDLRIEGVVVEYLGGIDDLDAIVEPTSARGPAGGSACSSTIWSPVRRRRASLKPCVGDPAARTRWWSGHPFIDIWQAVKPGRIGVPAWPVIPKGMDWKKGVCRAAGLAARPAGRHRQGVAADPGPGARLERSGARAHRPGRGTDRLRDANLRSDRRVTASW